MKNCKNFACLEKMHWLGTDKEEKSKRQPVALSLSGKWLLKAGLERT